MNATKHSKQFINIMRIRLTGVNAEPMPIPIVKVMKITQVNDKIAA